MSSYHPLQQPDVSYRTCRPCHIVAAQIVCGVQLVSAGSVLLCSGGSVWGQQIRITNWEAKLPYDTQKSAAKCMYEQNKPRVMVLAKLACLLKGDLGLDLTHHPPHVHQKCQ